jgi:hypothetical protein
MSNRMKGVLEAAAKIADIETQTLASFAAQCRNDGDEESSDMYERKRRKSSSLTKQIKALAATA